MKRFAHTASAGQEAWDAVYKAWLDDRLATCFERASAIVESSPEVGQAWLVLGSVLHKLRRHQQAVGALQKASRLLRPDRKYLALSEMGHLYRSKGNYTASERWYRKAIDASPESGGCRIFLGGLLARQGRLKEAEQAHRSALELNDCCRDEAHFNLGLILRGGGNYEKAQAHFEKALEMAPADSLYMLHLRHVKGGIEARNRPLDSWAVGRRVAWKAVLDCYGDGSVVEGVERAWAFLEAYPEDGFGWTLYSSFLWRLAQYDDAVVASNKALKVLQPEHRPVAWRERGDMYRRKGQYRSAQRWYQKVVESGLVEPHDFVALGELYERRGLIEEAEDQYVRALRLGNKDAAVLLGLLHRVKGEYQSALDTFNRVLDEDSEDLEAKDYRDDVAEAIRIRNR